MVVAVPAQTSDLFVPKYVAGRMLTVTRWQLAHPKHEQYDWTNGAFYAGVFAEYDNTGSDELMDTLIAMGEQNGWRRLNIIDKVVRGRFLL